MQTSAGKPLLPLLTIRMLLSGIPRVLAKSIWWGWDDVWFPDPQSACSYQVRLHRNVAVGAVFHHMEQANSSQYKCYATHPNYGSTIFYASNATLNTGCASQYTLNTSTTTCEKTGTRPDN